MAVLKVKHGTDWVPVTHGTESDATEVIAWVSFNGSTGDIHKAKGITGITKKATGIYDINFEKSQPDMNYGTHVTPGNGASETNSLCGIVIYAKSTVNQAEVVISYYSNNERDVDPVYVSFFRL